MAGLREKQKAAREKRILEAAVTKFRAVGYRSVRLEDLAEAAEVAVGTVYNYYRTKGDILIAVVAMEVEEVLVAGDKIVANPPADVGTALRKLVFGYYDHSLQYLSKEMWRTAMALTIEAPTTPNGRGYSALDARLAEQVVALLDALDRSSLLKPRLDTTAIGEVLFNNLNQMFVEFVKDDAMPLSTLRSKVARQIDAVAELIGAS
ncbi:MAG: TetR/AcrR family transcriptional regulator [Pseudomonadota bacterium]